MGESRPVTALTSGSSRPSRPATAEAGGYVGEHNLLQDEDHLIECDNVLVRFVSLACVKFSAFVAFRLRRMCAAVLLIDSASSRNKICRNYKASASVASTRRLVALPFAPPVSAANGPHRRVSNYEISGAGAQCSTAWCSMTCLALSSWCVLVLLSTALTKKA